VGWSPAAWGASAGLFWDVLPQGILFGTRQSLMISVRLSPGSPRLCHNSASVICETDFLFFSLICQLISEQRMMIKNRDEGVY